MTALQVKENELRNALVALGFKSADDPDKWSVERLNQKVADSQSFNALIEKATKQPGDSSVLDLLNNISDSLAEGVDVTVLADEEETILPMDHESNGHAEQATLVDESEPNDTTEEPQPKKKPSKKKKEKTVTTATMEKKPTKKTTKTSGKPAAKATGKATGKREGPSLLDAAVKVLKGKKHGMKTRAIWETIEKQGLWSAKAGKTPWATLGAAIYTEINKKGSEARFVQVDKGTFALS